MLIDPPVPEIHLFQNLTLKFRVKIMREDKVQNHQVCPSSYRFTSLCYMLINPPIPEIHIFFFKIWPWKFKVKVMWEVKVQGHKVCPFSYRFIFLSFCVNRPSYSCDAVFPHLILKIQGQGHKPMMFYNYLFRQFHRTLYNCRMVQIHPVVSETFVLQSLDPSGTWFDKCLTHGQAHMWQMGTWPWPCITSGLDNSTELRREKIRPSMSEICIPQILAAACPPGLAQQYSSSWKGWWIKSNIMMFIAHFLMPVDLKWVIQ